MRVPTPQEGSRRSQPTQQDLRHGPKCPRNKDICATWTRLIANELIETKRKHTECAQGLILRLRPDSEGYPGSLCWRRPTIREPVACVSSARRAGAARGPDTAQLEDLCLGLRRHLVRALLGFGAPVGERAEALVRIPAEPRVDGLARDPVASYDVGDARAVQDLEDGLVSLLHQIQLHQHGRPPSVLSTGRQRRRRWQPTPGGRSQARSVKQAQEPVSPMYRSRAGKCQAGGGATVASMNRAFTVGAGGRLMGTLMGKRQMLVSTASRSPC